MDRDHDPSPLDNATILAVAQSLRPLEPDPRRRMLMLERILGFVWRSAVAALRATEPKRPTWLEAGPAIAVQLLHEDRDSGAAMCLVRLPAGSRIRLLNRAVSVLLVAGVASVGGRRLRTGEWRRATSRLATGIVSSRQGGLVLLRLTAPVES